MNYSFKVNDHEIGCVGAILILLMYLSVPLVLLYIFIVGLINIFA